MQSTLYHDKSWGARDTAQDGAFSSVNRAWDHTHSGKWYIEQQRSGDQIIATGLAYRDPLLVDRGLRILEWGFAHQNPDGSFPCDDAFHSTSFFVEAAAHSFLLLEASPDAGEYASRIDRLRPKLARAARWMTQPAVEAEAKERNAVFTHRRFLVGAALGESAVVLHDQSLLDKSAAYIEDGLHLQQPDGVNPEKHGQDSNYQAVGLVFALRYYRLAASSRMQAQMYPHLVRAITWQKSRITPDGNVTADGNTRSGGQEDNRDGTTKSVNYTWTVRVLADWASITGNNEDARKAALVWKRWQQIKPTANPA